MGRTTQPMGLTDDERSTLEARAIGPDSHGERTPKHTLRAKIVLACAEGLDVESVAERVGLHQRTVEKWRDRFVQDRLRGLEDKPRSGAPRRISDAQIEDVLRRTLEPTPPGAAPWSLRTLARATGLSRSTIDRIWRTFGVTPAKNTSARPDNPSRPRSTSLALDKTTAPPGSEILKKLSNEEQASSGTSSTTSRAKPISHPHFDTGEPPEPRRFCAANPRASVPHGSGAWSLP